MKVYILEEVVPYEGSYTLGVYASKEAAMIEASRLASQSSDDCVDYVVIDREVIE